MPSPSESPAQSTLLFITVGFAALGTLLHWMPQTIQFTLSNEWLFVLEALLPFYPTVFGFIPQKSRDKATQRLKEKVSPAHQLRDEVFVSGEKGQSQIKTVSIRKQWVGCPFTTNLERISTIKLWVPAGLDWNPYTCLLFSMECGSLVDLW